MQIKSFPWKCSKCRQSTVEPSRIDYTASVEHDGRAYEVRIPALDVPKCRNCGTLVMTETVNRQISEALREAAGLLSPKEIRSQREQLGLTQRQLAGRLGVAEATLSRWETGAQIQQRSLDRFLRAYFAVAELRSYLELSRTLNGEQVEDAAAVP